MAPDYSLGFETLETEVEDVELEVEGSLPGWLEGTLVRNGPAKFEAGDTRMNHWFDGYAMLHAFEMDDGEVLYSNRYLETDAYNHA
ncbi:MAG: carotenoid oxygenase family protein, partial [Halobacteria archaeon]|nr:carotenoid oxygenase family protein [Halobacteria archaeon]